ncbi:hypothetical protein KM043_001896 [Ampulex compressa]|nr:hypothetical protein KM043_001896 [Ampulex compressa]
MRNEELVKSVYKRVANLREREYSINRLILSNNTEAIIDHPAMKMYVESLQKLKAVIRGLFREKQNMEMESTVRRWKIATAISILVLLILSTIIIFTRNSRVALQRSVDVLLSKAQDLRHAKLKSDQLLFQMLPPIVVKQLVHKKKVLVENFDCVTIFFCDIVGYTNLSASSTPMQMLNTLDTLYELYDLLIKKYDVYKVETIGDSYMVIGGLLREHGLKHANEVAMMSMDLLECTKTFVIPHRPRGTIKIRIGINTGQCVAGVVGSTMPHYSFFGDAINTASRMESTGEAMKIQISQSTKDALESLGCYETKFRGSMEIKGKGEMNTYWLLRKQEFPAEALKRNRSRSICRVPGGRISRDTEG